MERLFQACQHQNEEIVEYALQCLREITTQEYDTMHFYFDQLGLATSTLAKHPASRVGAQAFEFWTTLVEDETERIQKNVTCLGYINSCYEHLLDLILEGLCIINFDEDDDDEDWGHALSAACCLQKLSIFIKDLALPKVINFASANIGQSNWKQKYAALIALGSVTEGPKKDEFMGVIVQALPNLIELFSDGNAKVREALSWVFKRICEHHAGIFTDLKIASECLPRLIKSLEDRARISNQCCAAIERLAENSQPFNGEPANCLTPFY